MGEGEGRGGGIDMLVGQDRKWGKGFLIKWSLWKDFHLTLYY